MTNHGITRPSLTADPSPHWLAGTAVVHDGQGTYLYLPDGRVLRLQELGKGAASDLWSAPGDAAALCRAIARGLNHGGDQLGNSL